uniref:Peptidyl-prolyl cis-trans isomerase n=2 Tax=Pelagomonas calceolata TaxID=35677 RepID=A0A7S3ZWK9_9STRA
MPRCDAPLCLCPARSDAAPCTALTTRHRRDPTHSHNSRRAPPATMAVFSRITLLAGTAARCVHAMNRRGLAMANPTATFKTTKGEFKVELFQDQLPITTSNFKDLATSGFYDGLTFHRVIKGFMCQFGCPNSANPQSPIAGTGGPPGNTQYTLPDGSVIQRDGGGNIPDELVGEISNEVGTISMANTGAPNSGGSQFFLNTKHNAFLDYFDNSTPSKHPVFGKVVDGMDVVSAIEGVPTDGRDKPIDAVRVESITIAE